MKKKFLQYAFLGVALIAVFSSCRKQSFGGEENPTAGKTFVWITEAQVSNQFFDVFTDIKPVTMFTVRRDAANNTDLKKAVSIKLTAMDQAFITAHAGDSYTKLPTDIYTLSAQPGVTLEANTDLTLNFASGDFAKNIIFNIDGSKVDLSKQYAVAYVITNFGGFSKRHDASGVSQDTIIATVAIKNRWDGTYAITGTMTDVANPALTHANDALGADAPLQVELRTISATQNVVYDNYVYGGVYVIISNAGSVSSYGQLGRVVTFDPATNKVVSMVNYYGQPSGNGRSLALNPDGVNTYDPGTKTIPIKYNMLQPGVAGVPPSGIRTQFDEVWTYIGSR